MATAEGPGWGLQSSHQPLCLIPELCERGAHVNTIKGNSSHIPGLKRRVLNLGKKSVFMETMLRIEFFSSSHPIVVMWRAALDGLSLEERDGKCPLLYLTWAVRVHSLRACVRACVCVCRGSCTQAGGLPCPPLLSWSQNILKKG